MDYANATQQRFIRMTLAFALRFLNLINSMDLADAIHFIIKFKSLHLCATLLALSLLCQMRMESADAFQMLVTFR